MNSKRLAASLSIAVACAVTQVQSTASAAATAPTLPVLVALKAAQAGLGSIKAQRE